MSNADVSEQPRTQPRPGLPRWVVVVLGLLLAAILAIGAATLYLVAEIDDQQEQAGETAKTVTATKALLDRVAARQLKDQDIPARLEAAVEEMTRLITETEAAITATNEAIAETNQTLADTNALIDQAEAFVVTAQESAASLESQIDELEQGQQQLASRLNAQLARVQTRLADIQERLGRLRTN